MKSRARLSALVVNYNSGAFAVTCVDSLLVQWERSGRARDDLDVVVVDNASPVDQEEHLVKIEALGATVIRHDENGGYSKGMNLALSHTDGGPKDVVAILNPDLCFLPGAIDVLMDYLEDHPECGLVTPKATIDPIGKLNLPRNFLPTFWDQALMGASVIYPWVARHYSKKRFPYNHELWSADGPLISEMISGCCMFLRRETMGKIGGLLDERYPLYYEDTDLVYRITQANLTIVHHCGSRVLHHWSRSAGVGDVFAGEPQRRYEISRKLYFDRWYGPIRRRLMGFLDRWFASRPDEKKMRPIYPMQQLGGFDGPVEIQLPRKYKRILVEISVNPLFLVAVGIYADDVERWVCPEETWAWYFQSEYWSRVMDLETGEMIGAYQFSKTVPGRNEPMSAEELRALGSRVFGGQAV